MIRLSTTVPFSQVGRILTTGLREIGMDTSVTWDRVVTQILDRLRARFQRSAAHVHAVEYVRGLMGDAERKNS